MRLSELIVWLVIIVCFTDASQTIIEIIHGPQPKAEVSTTQPSQPKQDGELKPSW